MIRCGVTLKFYDSVNFVCSNFFDYKKAVKKIANKLIALIFSVDERQLKKRHAI